MTLSLVQSSANSEFANSVHPLDNVIWNALNTRQSHLAEVGEQARRFLPEISPLGAFEAPTKTGYESLAALVPDAQTVGLFPQEPYREHPGWKVIAAMPLPQMVYDGNESALATGNADNEIVELGVADVPEMLALTALTKPGPFNQRTHELGRYVGILRDGKLVAMAGERLKIPGFTEVSAVCTHPDYAGRGFARLLMIDVMRKILQRGEIPFLHTRADNVHAIGLYERIGFRQRRLLHLAVLRRTVNT